jgi:protoporphyrinogen oxidase
LAAGVVILGAGVSGLAAAWASGHPAFEAEQLPGGICRSYYQRPGSDQRLSEPPEDGGAYRFEIGGGHWIFGGDPFVLRFLEADGALASYTRRAAVYFPAERRLVPFPLQYHLSHLEPGLARRAFEEIRQGARAGARTMAEWLEASLGRTLMELFFAPFHERYTAGLWTRIAPQDGYKIPVNVEVVEKGLRGEPQTEGYNATFHYPSPGLQAVTNRLARGGKIEYGRRVARVDLQRREIEFAGGGGARYRTLVSTLPLNRMAALAGLDPAEDPWPSSSVLVLNLGATRGPACPDAHWIYVATSRSGFYRVGFYSNVDAHFLPAGAEDRVALYVERAYPDGARPSEEEIQQYARSVIEELREWGFIGEVEVVSPTWVDVAYTWALPGSRWREQILGRLEQHGVLMTGRYGLWRFQGIAESIRDGFVAGAALREQGA